MFRSSSKCLVFVFFSSSLCSWLVLPQLWTSVNVLSFQNCSVLFNSQLYSWHSWDSSFSIVHNECSNTEIKSVRHVDGDKYQEDGNKWFVFFVVSRKGQNEWDITRDTQWLTYITHLYKTGRSHDSLLTNDKIIYTIIAMIPKLQCVGPKEKGEKMS
jgi:hypothetical protein